MVQSWIVESFAVRDQGAKDGADLQQLIPIMVVASQTGGIKAEYQPNTSQAHLGEQSLETTTRFSLGSGFAQILINELYPLTGPS